MKNRAPFLKHSVIYGAGSLLTQLAGLVLIPVYTRCLDLGDYGALELLTRLGDVVVIALLGRGLRQATLTFYRQAASPDDRNRVASTIITTFAGLAVLGIVLGMATSSQAARLLQVRSPAFVVLAIAAVFLDALNTIPLALIQARMESHIYVVATCVQFFLRIGLTLLLVTGLRAGLIGVLSAACAVSCASALLLCGRELMRGFRFDSTLLPAILEFTWPFVPGGLCLFVLNWGDRFFLLRHWGLDSVGVYSLGYKLAMVVTAFTITPLYMVWSVRMYDAAKLSDGPRTFGLIFTRLIGLYIAAALALAVFQDEVVRIAGGARYADAAWFVAPIVLAYGLLAGVSLMDAGFYVTRRTRSKAWISMASAVATFLLYAALIPTMGAKGAAFATLVGFLVQFVLTYVLSQRCYRVEYEWDRLGLVLASAMGLWFVSRLLPGTPAGFVARCLLLMAWPIGLWVLGVLSLEEKRWVAEQGSRLGKRFLARRNEDSYVSVSSGGAATRTRTNG